MALNPNTFVTLNDVKLHLGIAAGDTSLNALLEYLINAATDYVEKYCNRKFKEDDYIEKQNGDDSSLISTKNYPISESSPPTVKVDGEDRTIESVDFLKGFIQMVDCVPEGIGNIEVTYTAGWTDEQIPFDLKEAVISIVIMLKNSIKSAGVESETVGDYTVSYGMISSAISPIAKTILAKYRDWV